MKTKRIDWLYKGSNVLVKSLSNNYFDINYEGVENIPEVGACLVVSKHQSMCDIALAADLLMKKGRLGNYIMKDILPDFFNWYGAIQVPRPKDYGCEKGKTRLMRKNLVSALNYSKEAFNRGEMIVLYPEGTRVLGEMGEIDMGFIKFSKRFEKEIGKEIPVLPVGINYEIVEGKKKRVKLSPGSKINVKAGKILSLDEVDKTTLEYELKYLSGI